MVGLTRLGFCLLLIPFASAGMTSVILRAVGRSHAYQALRSAQDPASQTLHALDLNKDGHIDRSEVAAFAQDEGVNMDADTETDDFSGLDTNGDGVLDSAELLQVLGGAGPGTKQPQFLQNASSKDASAPKPPLAVAEKAKSVQDQPHVVKGLSTEKPQPTQTGKSEPRISIQVTHPAEALEAKAQVQAPQSPLAQQAAQTLRAPQAPLVVDAVKPTPVQRMVKHFAQVLRESDVLPVTPAHEEATKLAKSNKEVDTKDKASSMASETVTEETTQTRATVQSAAKEVADQLLIAETAEAKARVLDRKAAEERANATVLAKMTTQEALNAGAAAAHKKANELMAKMARIEDQAERAQVRSSALHSKAKLETEEASELMGVADRALNHSPTKSK